MYIKKKACATYIVVNQEVRKLYTNKWIDRSGMVTLKKFKYDSHVRSRAGIQGGLHLRICVVSDNWKTNPKRILPLHLMLLNGTTSSSHLRVSLKYIYCSMRIHSHHPLPCICFHMDTQRTAWRCHRNVWRLI